MMKRIALLVTVLSIPAWPQIRGGGRMGNPGGNLGRGPGIFSAPAPVRTFGSPHGFGNVLFPGTGHAPGTFSPFSIVDPTFGARLTNTVSGFGPVFGGGRHFGGRRHFGGSGAVIVPYAVPVYVYPEPQPQVYVAPSQVIYVVPGEPDRSLTTQAPQRESIVTYVAPSRAAPEPSPAGEEKKHILIALRNYSIYSATEYWVEGETLHYITHYGAHNQASLDQVDLEFTKRLNRERGVEFRLDKSR
jgi:hypothetical protein